jgi:hypothetical protein
MRLPIPLCAAILAFGVGAAHAQVPVIPPITPPPDGTLSVTRSQSVVNPDGTTQQKVDTTYRNPQGVVNEGVSRTTTNPPLAVVTTEQNSATTTTTKTLGPAPNKPGNGH